MSGSRSAIGTELPIGSAGAGSVSSTEPSTNSADKRHRVFDTPHDLRLRRTDLVAEVLAWYDKYLGRVRLVRCASGAGSRPPSVETSPFAPGAGRCRLRARLRFGTS